MRPFSVLFLLSATLLPFQLANAADSRELHALNQQIRDTLARRRPPSPDLLSRRAALLRAAIREDAGTARSLLLRDDELAALRQASGVQRSVQESPAAYTAEEAVVYDSADWRSAYYVYQIATPRGRVAAYQSSAVGTLPECGSRMRVDGYQIGDTMLVTTATVVSQASQPPCSTLGEQKSAVILVNFPSRPISKQTVDQYAATFFTGTPSVNDFYWEMSYGKATVSGDVLGPYTLDRDYDSCADSATVAKLGMAAADADVDLTRYNRVFVIAPPPTTCGFGGYSDLGCATYTLAHAGQLRISQIYEFDANAPEILRTAPHELGHGLGVGHARTDAVHNEPLTPDRTRMAYSEYADGYSSMGGGGPHHFAAPHKLKLNWLEADEVAEVTADLDADLLPLSSFSHGLKALHVVRQVGPRTQYLWIEYRVAKGYDSSLATNLMGGALIHFEDSSTGTYTELLNYGASFTTAELRAGTSWSDPYSNLTVQVGAATPDGLHISIRHEPLCNTIQWPSQMYFPAEGFSFNASVSENSCPWAASGNNFWLQAANWAPEDLSIRFDGAANTDPGSRSGSVTAMRQTFFLVQYPPLGAGTPSRTFSFTQSELGVSRAPSSTTLQFSTSLRDGQLSWISSSPWLRVTDYQVSRAGCPCVTLAWDSNLTDRPRSAVLTAGTVDGTPIPNVVPLSVIQDSGTSAGDYLLTTVAGKETAPDGQPALSTILKQPAALAADSAGNLFVAESDGYRIRRIARDGSISRYVGIGYPSSAPNTGTLESVSVIGPMGLAMDGNDNLYFGTAGRIRVGRSDGSVSVLAGSGSVGFAGDGAAAAQATVGFPIGIAVGADGSVYFSDYYAHRIRKITPDGVINTVAGTGTPGYSGDNGPATSASLNYPWGVALAPDGTLFIADRYNHRIRRLNQDGTISLVAGTGSCGSTGDGGPATAARLCNPMAVAVDLSGNVLVGDSSNYRVRRISTDGRITTLAGNGLSPGAKDNGPATSTPIGSPTGLLTMPNGDVYVSDNNSNRIWLTHEGMVSPVAGIGNSSPAGDGDLALTAAFYRPSALALDSSGNLLIADNLMHRVRKLLPDGTVQAFAGTGQSSVSGDGHAAASAGLPYPTGIAVGVDGAVYIPSLYQIRKIDSSGTISLLAGSYYGYADSTTPAKVMFAGLGGIALDSAGNLYVADTGNQRIRKISPTGAVITVAGTGATGMPVDGVPATESPLNSPSDVAIDAGGNLYIADRNSYCVRKVTPGGTITTFAGTPRVYGNSGDGGPAASARFGTVESVKLAPDGSVWVSDSSFNVVRRIDPAGIITTVAGSGSPGFAVDGPAWAAQLLTPTGLAVTTNGVYIADSGSARVLLLTRP